MNIELILNSKGSYEIWTDKQCITIISRRLNEPPDDFKRRSEAEFDSYVEKLRNLANPRGGRTVKQITL